MEKLHLESTLNSFVSQTSSFYLADFVRTDLKLKRRKLFLCVFIIPLRSFLGLLLFGFMVTENLHGDSGTASIYYFLNISVGYSFAHNHAGVFLDFKSGECIKSWGV